MNKKSLALGLLCMAAFPLSASAATGFHKASSTPEKALDAILMRQKNDAAMTEYLIQNDTGKNDARYAAIFTPAFKKSVAKAQAAQIKKECGGKESPDMVCGLDFSPVTCSQDTTDTHYLYNTSKVSDKAATIAYAWPNEGTASATYKLVKQEGAWKIDGVRCADGASRFNMK